MSWAQLAVVLLIAGLVAGGSFVLWRRVRSQRIRRLMVMANTPDPGALTRIAEVQEAVPDGAQYRTAHLAAVPAAVEGAAVATLAIPAEALWTIAQVDPNVARGVSQSSARDSDGNPVTGDSFQEFLRFVESNSQMVDNEGFMARLQGYVAEQDAADIFRASGSAVDVADTANQIGWDLVVDGAQVNVKSLTDIGGVVEAARQNPDITYFVNEDISGASDLPNIVVLDGLNRVDARERLAESLEAGIELLDGTFVLGALDGPIPLTLAAVIVLREARNVRRGIKSKEEAITDGTLAFVFQGTGIIAGAAAGAKVGLAAGLAVEAMSVGFTGGVAGSVGGMAGFIAGGALGSAAGKKAQEEVKLGAYRSAQKDLEGALRAYGQRCREGGALARLSHLIQGPSRRAHEVLAVLDEEARRAQGTWRWRLWPTEGQILAVAADEHAAQQVGRIDAETRQLISRFRAATSGQSSDEAIGLLFANQLDLRDNCGCEYPELDDVRLAFLRARRRRLTLSHPLTKSEQVEALKRLIRRMAAASAREEDGERLK
jgi:hypothetical protein